MGRSRTSIRSTNATTPGTIANAAAFGRWPHPTHSEEGVGVMTPASTAVTIGTHLLPGSSSRTRAAQPSTQTGPANNEAATISVAGGLTAGSSVANACQAAG